MQRRSSSAILIQINASNYKLHSFKTGTNAFVHIFYHAFCIKKKQHPPTIFLEEKKREKN
jgi:hypothetical protein